MCVCGGGGGGGGGPRFKILEGGARGGQIPSRHMMSSAGPRSAVGRTPDS